MSDERRGGFRPSGPREMHKATCADCGKETEVPFTARNATRNINQRDIRLYNNKF